MNPAIAPSTSDAGTWSLVQGWLDACVHAHRSCSAQAAGAFAPTRLLELYASGGETMFRLVDGYTTGRPAAEPYVTLSHCWGSGPAEEKLRLLGSTEGLLRAGLPVGGLPRLFRDAFEVAGRLGVRRVWIDRLCIVQDSAADWEAEAATMQTVYQHGFLNIAALGARDDRDGCFFERDVRLVAPTVFDLSPPLPSAPSSSSSSSSSPAAAAAAAAAAGNGEACPPSLYRFEAEDRSWRAAFEGEPLLGRAWVLQERVLAGRNLYFGRRQVFWECCEASRCETVPGRNLVQPAMPQIPRAPWSEDGEPVRRSWKSLIDSAVGGGGGWGGGKHHLDQWPAVVRRYCQCSLTFPTDKLVALSGLAKDMGSKLRAGAGDDDDGYDSYLAGLWRDTMPQSLLWKPKLPSRRSPLYRAPSWSWASVDSDIEFSNAGGKDTSWYPSLIGAQTVPRGRDITGELVGGTVVLSSPMCVARGIKAVKTNYGERETHSIKSFHHPDTQVNLQIECRHAYVQFDTQNHYDQFAVILFKGTRNKQFSHLDVHGLSVIAAADIYPRFHRVGYVFFQAITADGGFGTKDVLSKIPVKSIEII